MHLFIVLTDPCERGFVVLANITEWKGDHCDATTRLVIGDHPFLHKDSYVAYHYAQMERAITIEAGVNQSRFVQKEDFTEPKLTEIEDGLINSRYTPRKVKNYLNRRRGA